MPETISITDIKSTNEISNLCRSTNEPVFITKNGYREFVVMSVETYETMLLENELDAAIASAESEYENDKRLLDAREVFASLRGKHFG